MEGDMTIWTNLYVFRLTGQLITYYTENRRSTYNRGNMHWIEVLHTSAFQHKWVWRGAQNLYYEVTVLVAAPQCLETWQGDMTFGGRHEDLSLAHIFLYSSYQLYEVCFLYLCCCSLFASSSCNWAICPFCLSFVIFTCAAVLCLPVVPVTERSVPSVCRLLSLPVLLFSICQ